jgi:hypothetical protein
MQSFIGLLFKYPLIRQIRERVDSSALSGME